MPLHATAPVSAPFAIAAGLLFAAVAVTQNVPTGFVVDTLVTSGLTAPNDFCFLPDGRMLIANRPGNVTIWVNGQTATVGTVPGVELFGPERSLVSICPDPGFATNGYIYVWYPSTADSFMHLERFTCTGTLVSPTSTNLAFAAASRHVVLLTPDNILDHNGGTLRFGPDGCLYLSMGDDVQSCQAQVLSVLRGKLVRLDVSGLPPGGSTTAPTAAQLDPGDNPLSGAADASRLVIAYGLRNPFRLTIDPATNNLYIGDVGQTTMEELDEYVHPGTGPLPLVNYGWPWREGTSAGAGCTGTAPPSQNPIAAVAYSSGWNAIIGGPVYRNVGGPYDFGPAYEGTAFYADYGSGRVRRLVNSSGTWGFAPAVPGQPNAADWATGCNYGTSYQVGPDGALYVIQHPTGFATAGGTLKRIRPQASLNQIAAISGGGQVGVATEAFAQPLVARVLDPQGAPLPFGAVNFAVAGPATLSTTNPVVADANGFATTTATATNGGGGITVTATPSGSAAVATFVLFARDLLVAGTATTVVVQLTHSTTASPPDVPWILMAQLPGAVPLSTPIGLFCTNPTQPGFFVLEDTLGVFGFVSLSGTYALGNPGVVKTYAVPPGLLAGLSLNLQAVGLDPIAGLVRTDCELASW
jgi:glucose/arabinose dehydrogenase